MANKISEESLKEVANLSQIKLSEEEISEFTQDLSSILSYFDKLQELDTENVEVIGHITGMTNVYRREDIAKELNDKEEKIMMSNIPNKKERYIKVKNVL